MAIVIEGKLGFGASTSIRNPESSAASLAVALPKTAIRVLFCLNWGKLLYKDLIPEGEKKQIIS